MQEQSIQVIDERTIKINLLSGVKRGAYRSLTREEVAELYKYK